jgi:hypothetical protein
MLIDTSFVIPVLKFGFTTHCNMQSGWTRYDNSTCWTCSKCVDRALAMLFAPHEFSFCIPGDYYILAAQRVHGFTPGHASQVRKCHRCNEFPGDLCGNGSSSTTSYASISWELTPMSMLMDHITHCPCSHSFGSPNPIWGLSRSP